MSKELKWMTEHGLTMALKKKTYFSNRENDTIGSKNKDRGNQQLS